MEYLLTHAWLMWLGLAILTALAEVALPYFTFILATIGALAAAVVSLRFPPLAQAVTFGAATILSLLLVRPLRVARQSLPSRSHSLVGARGLVTTTLDPLGRITVADEDWSARAPGVIAAGRWVRVIGSDGIVLIVEEDSDGIAR